MKSRRGGQVRLLYPATPRHSADRLSECRNVMKSRLYLSCGSRRSPFLTAGNGDSGQGNSYSIASADQTQSKPFPASRWTFRTLSASPATYSQIMRNRSAHSRLRFQVT